MCATHRTKAFNEAESNFCIHRKVEFGDDMTHTHTHTQTWALLGAGAEPQGCWDHEVTLPLGTLEGNSKEVRLTTSINRVQTSKLGFFRRFLMTQDCTVCPPHSTTRLGEEMLAI